MTFRLLIRFGCRVIAALVLSLGLTTSLYAQDLEVRIMTNGDGTIAEVGMLVSVHYQGRLTDGTVFDDSNKRGEPISFTLGKGQVIKGWEQGIEGMKVGEKRVLTIPPELGYGAAGAGDVIPPNATLVFDVELVAAVQPPTLTHGDVDDMRAALSDGTIIVDIREKEEWAATGIIEGAHTITAFDRAGGLHPEFQSKFFGLIPNKDTKIMLYCHAGQRSASLGNALVDQLGYSGVTHLSGGIVAWTEADGAVVPYTP